MLEPWQTSCKKTLAKAWGLELKSKEEEGKKKKTILQRSPSHT